MTLLTMAVCHCPYIVTGPDTSRRRIHTTDNVCRIGQIDGEKDGEEIRLSGLCPSEASVSAVLKEPPEYYYCRTV